MKTKIQIYRDYLMLLLDHKKRVSKELIKRKQYRKAITHDLSSFLPSEFFAFADWYCSDYGIVITDIVKEAEEKSSPELYISNFWYQAHVVCRDAFEKAYRKHYMRNRHHVEYWINLRDQISIHEKVFLHLPEDCLEELLCDWLATSQLSGISIYEYILENYDNLPFNERDKKWLKAETRFE